MTDALILQIAIPTITCAFGAGGAWFTIKQSRKDVNGLGRKMSAAHAKAEERHQNVTLALMLLASPDRSSEIARLIKEGREEDDR